MVSIATRRAAPKALTFDQGQVVAYAKKQGFAHVRFAVMTPKMLLAIKRQLGIKALTPPSTPHLYIAPSGRQGKLLTGYEDAAAILASVQAAKNA